MKKTMIWMFGLVMVLMSACAFADDAPLDVQLPSGITLKQGFIIPWEKPDSGFANMTTTTIIRTHADEAFGKWNALWDGWSLDAAWTYDANTSNVGLMLGRHLGTLGNYLPFDYPLADKVDITLYPVGILVEHPTDHPEVSGASGAAIIKMDISF